MGNRRAYAYVAVGTVVTYLGVFGAWTNLGSIAIILGWGVVACLGVVLLGLGVGKVFADDGTGSAATPGEAPGKTDWPFDRRS